MDATHIAARARVDRTARAREAAGAGSLLSGPVFYALVSLVTLVSLMPDSTGPWREGVMLCGVFGLGALRTAGYLLDEGWRVREPRLLWPLLALAAFSLVQTLPLSSLTLSGVGDLQVTRAALSADPFETKRFAIRLLAFLLVGEMLLAGLSSERRLRVLVWALIGVGASSALLAVVQQRLPAEPLLAFFPYAGSEQGFGQMGSRNQFAFLMEMALGLVGGMMLLRPKIVSHLLIHLSLGLLLTAALVLTTSRGGLLGLLCLTVFLAVTVAKAQVGRGGVGGRDVGGSRGGGALLRIVPLSLALVLLLAAGVFWIGGESVNSRMEKLSDEVGVTHPDVNKPVRRLEIWRATWLLVKDHPVAGMGFGGYWVGISQYLDASGENVPYQAHNDYLEILASGGVIAAVLTVWFAAAWVGRARRSLDSAGHFPRACGVGAAAGLFAVAAHSAFDFGLHNDINALFFTALLVIPLAGGRLVRATDAGDRETESSAADAPARV